MTAKETAAKLNEASSGTDGMTENVTRNAMFAGEIAEGIMEVSQTAEEMADCGVRVDLNAREISG